MIEVEAKVKVGNLEGLRDRIKKIARFARREKKVDDYYTLESRGRYPKKSLRVRRKKNYHEVNFKQWLSYKKGVYAKKEVEFKVSDLPGFYELLEDFGFRRWLRKVKDTELYKIKDNFHIELNYVKNLGWFMEIEYLCRENEIGKARHEVLNVLKKLGVGRKNIVKKGYTRILWEKR